MKSAPPKADSDDDKIDAAPAPTNNDGMTRWEDVLLSSSFHCHLLFIIRIETSPVNNANPGLDFCIRLSIVCSISDGPHNTSVRVSCLLPAAILVRLKS